MSRSMYTFSTSPPFFASSFHAARPFTFNRTPAFTFAQGQRVKGGKGRGLEPDLSEGDGLGEVDVDGSGEAVPVAVDGVDGVHAHAELGEVPHGGLLGSLAQPTSHPCRQ